ncbi:HET-domain-containing protein [Trametes polyzona]|nr:HET-domain-containing protein [Trametes polyzona]
MWLLTTDRAELKWFDRPPRKYAILSHVWQKGENGSPEQTFQELWEAARVCVNSGGNPRDLVSPKIRDCCLWAQEHGLELLWIDTCCIDKTNSAELHEAINSMFAWYASATVCYAFLYDVTTREPPNSPDSTFRNSVWFKRGWTLQELIAPKVVIFLSQDWIPIASKHSISDVLEEITGIDAAVLLGTKPLHEVSVARRMSWASKRETTRVEDEAYCLMGIFGVHLPTIYGEGKQAFLRLQEEIMRRIPDTTLFAWGPRGDPVETMVGYRSVFPTSRGTTYIERSCLLAPNAAAFANCSDLQIVSKKIFAAAYAITPHNPSFTVTSHGIQATCPVVHFPSGCTLLLLPCCKAESGTTSLVALILRFQGEGSPWCVGARTLREELKLERRNPGPSASLVERLLARSPAVVSRRSHMDVRCVLLPLGFNFRECLQRPLKQQVQSLIPIWERSYIAYRTEHVLCQDPAPLKDSTPVFQRQPSRSPSYRLFFPEWVILRLGLCGFDVPRISRGSSLDLSAGEHLSIPFFNWVGKEQIRMDLRTEVHPDCSLADGPLVAALWCSILIPSDGAMSLDAQVNIQDGLWGRSSGILDEENFASGSSGVPSLADGEDDIELEAGFVDLWEHSGRKGSKEFFSGSWRFLLTFTRLCDTPGADDAGMRNVYLVDINPSPIET